MVLRLPLRFQTGFVYFGLFVTVALAVSHETDGDNIIVATDSDPQLQFTVESTSGSLTSIIYDGKETQDQSGKLSQINSGIGASCEVEDTGDTYVKVTCTADGIIHYYVAKDGDPAIHMATYTSAEPEVGELRYIARLDDSVITTGPTASDREGSEDAVEGSDVFWVSNEETRSKFYSSVRFIEDNVHGATGDGIGAFFIIPARAYEYSSGGPFFRDINDQHASQQEVTWYMNSNHAQTEEYRQGLHGPYAIWFTDGSTPDSGSFDPNFWDDLDIEGWISESGRGQISGTASGIPDEYADSTVIGWSNDDAQYWALAGSDGSFKSIDMIPGTYTQTLYKNELAVSTKEVTATAGETSTEDIASEEDDVDAIWQIGEFDGTVAGFLNADKIETMHPSDSRMSAWDGIIFTVGSSETGDFPLAIFKDIGTVTVNFNITSDQTGERTLEIGTTLAFAGGRPSVTIGDWTGEDSGAPDQPDSRGITRGTWRGNNIRYKWTIPEGTLTSDGVNTLEIGVTSGSSGEEFLSPNFVVDALRLS